MMEPEHVQAHPQSNLQGSEPHGGTEVASYLIVFGALTVFTLISFLVNSAVRKAGFVNQHLFAIQNPETGFTIILLVAVIKAVLVGTFFMHLKFDWGRLYFMIIPVLILGTLLVVVLLPDMVLAWHH